MNDLITPPLKIQGKKTKLVPSIMGLANKIIDTNPEIDTWVEPFFGTGAVGFNCPDRIKNIIVGDINPHIVEFYESINNGYLNTKNIKHELSIHCKHLMDSEENGYAYYREMVYEFNETKDPMLFLALTRTSFNGLMRFNKKGEWNVPYCKDNKKLNEHLVDNLCKEIEKLSVFMHEKKFSIECCDYKKILEKGKEYNSIVYCDPPYYGLYTNYYNTWNEENEKELCDSLKSLEKPYIVSTWYNNGVKENETIKKYWSNCNIELVDHKYIIGAKSGNRRNVSEAILYNFKNQETNTDN